MNQQMRHPPRILIYGLNFAPELTGIGKYTGELAGYLIEHGYSVRIVTSYPYYPQWRILDGFSANRYLNGDWNGAKITRCPLWVPRQPSGLKRILHLGSFAFFSFLPVLLNSLWRPDLVINVVPTVLTIPATILLAKIVNAKSWLHIQDFELEAASALGLLPGFRRLTIIGTSFELLLYNLFDRTSTISDSMVLRLREMGISEDKTFLFPNWVDCHSIYPLSQCNPLKNEWNIDENKIVVLYSGNMGHKQGLEILIEAAKLLVDKPDILFVICGDGSTKVDLERRAANLLNARFYPLQPLEKLNELLNLADIHVLPQRSNAADLVMPSKLLGMLASGKPVVATASPGTALARVAGKVGVIVPPDSPKELADAIITLARDKHRRSYLGTLGRSYVEEHWDKEKVLSRFLNTINKLIDYDEKETLESSPYDFRNAN